MTKIKKILAGLLAAPVLSAQAYPAVFKALEEVSGNCIKYPTHDARDACQQKYEASDKAFDRYKQQQDARDKASQPQFKQPASQKPSGLCFTRRATGEVVCPN